MYLNPLKQAWASLSFKALVSICIALCLAVALLGCANAPPAAAVGPKVQTVQELMVKLKKGFDEGTLDTPEFYAKELGYPLERMDELKINPALNNARREIKFDRGELKGFSALVGPWTNTDGRKFLGFIFNYFPAQLDGSCFNLAQMQAIWGKQAPVEPEIWGAHGPLPVRHYGREVLTPNGSLGFISYVVHKRTSCADSRFSVSQTF